MKCEDRFPTLSKDRVRIDSSRISKSVNNMVNSISPWIENGFPPLEWRTMLPSLKFKTATPFPMWPAFPSSEYYEVVRIRQISHTTSLLIRLVCCLNILVLICRPPAFARKHLKACCQDMPRDVTRFLPWRSKSCCLPQTHQKVGLSTHRISGRHLLFTTNHYGLLSALCTLRSCCSGVDLSPP